jgi:hypothetical protein
MKAPVRAHGGVDDALGRRISLEPARSIDDGLHKI